MTEPWEWTDEKQSKLQQYAEANPEISEMWTELRAALAEIERLEAANSAHNSALDAAAQHIHEYASQIERLKQENGALRECLCETSLEMSDELRQAVQAEAGDASCCARSPIDGYFCTRAARHAGPHVATGVDRNVALEIWT